MTTLVAERTRHPEAAKRSPSGVTTTRSSRARERSMASSQPSTRTARPTRVSSTDSATDPPWRTCTWRRTGSALLPGGSSPVPTAADDCRGVRIAPVTPPSRKGGQCGLGRAPSVDHHGRDAGADGGFEGGVPALVDLHQVDQRTDHAVDVAEQLAPCPAGRPACVQCLGPGLPCRGVPLRPRPPTPVPSPRARTASSSAALRTASSASSADVASSSSSACLARRSARTAARAGPLLEGAHAGPSASRCSCSRSAARAIDSGSGTDTGDGLVGRVLAPSTLAQRCRSAAASPSKARS